MVMGIGNNHLYTLGHEYNKYSGVSYYLTGFPLTAISPTTSVVKSYNTSQVIVGQFQATFLYYYQNVLTLICGQYVSHTHARLLRNIYSKKSDCFCSPLIQFTITSH